MVAVKFRKQILSYIAQMCNSPFQNADFWIILEKSVLWGKCTMTASDSKFKEDLSISYISALAANAGIYYETQRHDEDSTDGILKQTVDLVDGGFYTAELHVQLKATSSSSQYSERKDSITYQLKSKNYNDLCRARTAPIILALLILPKESNEWTKWTPTELMLKGSMYWASFKGYQRTSNVNSIAVNILKSQRINVNELKRLMEIVAKEEDL